ncbi:uncharacterized protein LOC131665854 [Phymastichus coffea]|uniref:uncharacterized protein LOC131665854 n=1 Tax=Phymastichus coffea TaxID=108790 RepID=UPI00273AA2E9|nr:uncharacterized protein LOC131665854 [Phymastichus coffea]XP_058794006.1 uncharacterized protein LOC131665854 [Phymastichus coffea]
MALMRMTLSALARSRFGAQALPRFSANGKPRPRDNMVFGFVACNFLSTHRLTKNIELLVEDNVPITKNVDKKVIINPNADERPLLVLLCWLQSKRKHIMKFVNFYMEQGFDVVTVSITPWQLMWPVNGSRIIASDLLDFLDQNKQYKRVLLHGFSVGGYMWGEVLDFVHQDRKKYDHVINRVVGHVWDSAADISEFTIGTPKAIFPNNEVLQNATRSYLEYHMKVFHKQATQYWIRSSQLFHLNLVRSPALFLVSKTDPVGSLESNMRVRDSWESLGTKTYTKVFEDTPHVGHFRAHPKEYVAELYTFLDRLQLIQNQEKIRARL